MVAIICLAATQQGAEPGDQFPGVAGFAQVVICSQFQPQYAIDRFAPCAQHQYGYLGLLPECAQQIQSVDAGQHQVKNDCFMYALQRTLQATVTIVDALQRKAFAAQPVAEQGAEFLVVIDHQNSGVGHRLIPAPGVDQCCAGRTALNGLTCTLA